MFPFCLLSSRTYLLHKVGSEQQISQADEGHCAEGAEQDASEEQVAAAFRQHGRCAQAGEDGSCADQSRNDDGRVDVHDLFQHQAHRVPGECTKSQQQSQSQVEVFSVIRCEDQAQHQTQRDECTEESGFPYPLEVDQ